MAREKDTFIYGLDVSPTPSCGTNASPQLAADVIRFLTLSTIWSHGTESQDTESPRKSRKRSNVFILKRILALREQFRYVKNGPNKANNVVVRELRQRFDSN